MPEKRGSCEKGRVEKKGDDLERACRERKGKKTKGFQLNLSL